MSVSRAAPTRIALRDILEGDRDEIVALLMRGYGAARPRAFWTTAFDRLAQRDAPADYPRFGFVLVSDERIVGVLLLIFAQVKQGATSCIRCNGSSLYVEPDYRLYTPLLTAATNKYKEVTVLNVTAAPHTHAMVSAQGFRPYNRGIFHAVPLAGGMPGADGARVLDAAREPDAAVDPWARAMLRAHRAYGCDTLWCIAEGESVPFIFRRTYVKGLARAARLIYAPSLDAFVRCAPALGRFYAKRLCFILTADVEGRLPLPGWFLPGRDIRFFRGPNPPKPGDLAFTELALLDHERGWS